MSRFFLLFFLKFIHEITINSYHQRALGISNQFLSKQRKAAFSLFPSHDVAFLSLGQMKIHTSIFLFQITISLIMKLREQIAEEVYCFQTILVTSVPGHCQRDGEYWIRWTFLLIQQRQLYKNASIKNSLYRESYSSIQALYQVHSDMHGVGIENTAESPIPP